MNIRGLDTLEFPKIISMLENKASSAIGKELCQQLIPTNDLHQALQMQEETKEALDVIRLKGGLPLGGIRDIRAYIKRLNIGGNLTAEQLLEISNTLYAGKKVKRSIINLADKNPLPILLSHATEINELEEIEGKINSCINEYGEIMDTASPALRTIRQQIRTLEARVKEKLEQILRNTSNQKMLQEPIITIRNGRYVIPVKQEYRSVFGGMVHDQSASGATLFIEPEVVVQINNQLKETQMKEEKEIEKILKELSDEVRLEADTLTKNIEHLSKLDFIQAKAELALEMKATMPKLNDLGIVDLKKARHPLIPANKVVPINIHLGKEFNSIVITGPNTGGKTVTLKTLGLLTLMAMAGLHIPAEDESEVAVFSAVYADIGDEQSIEQSLSTFSGHLTNIVDILAKMNSDSLILLDELGAGTDPTEGAALAIAILEKIRTKGAKVVATTHYSELKAYAYNRKDVINASVEFDVETLRPTYRLLIGVPGRSNAFAIAKRLGLSQDIIDFAKGQISDDNLQVESMIESLEKNQRTAEKERYQAELLRKEIEIRSQELEEKIASFESNKLRLLEEARQSAEAIVKKAKKEAEEIIAELRKMAKEEQVGIKEHRLIEMKKRLDESVPEVAKPKPRKKSKNAKIEIGDQVKVLSYGQKGTVLEKVSDKEYLVQIGILKMKIDKSDLEVIEVKQKQHKEIKLTTVKRSSDAKSEIDVRGKTVEEAIIEIDRYLDEAFMQGFGQVSIIHGKGTGALRTGLQNFLKKHPHVKRTRLGQFSEGGSGVTVVELK
ncbi:endonuclease MutS2 [Vulcanibacillus modesticaldus]|uniref:endonuclease MutS2 n=1 Tax=Vulcanibacillus modesticaldus TaxID=337097 RepID=UPI000A5FE9F0|nr:endonuclease MutS2 [Vulcanibacillus modesticaldus]